MLHLHSLSAMLRTDSPPFRSYPSSPFSLTLSVKSYFRQFLKEVCIAAKIK